MHCDVQNRHGETALHIAALFGKVDSVEYLLRSGADPHVVSLHYETPLDLAEQQNHMDIQAILYKALITPRCK